jgi:hypothetical protein
MNRPTKDQLLAHYAKRQPKRFTQIDGFTEVLPYEVLAGDPDGHSVSTGETFELMSGAYAIRLLITEGTEKVQALALLDKIKSAIAGDRISLSPIPKLAIKLNSVLTNDPCALCGARTDPSGVDLFLDESMKLVCDECGLRHAPELMTLLRRRESQRITPLQRRARQTTEVEDFPF